MNYERIGINARVFPSIDYISRIPLYKTTIICFSLLIVTQSVNAQFLHIGLSGNAKRMDFVSGNDLGDSTYTFYFANYENESYRFERFKEQTKPFFAPSLYVRYSTRNNFFGELDLSINRPKAVAKYDNSVPLSTFNRTFNSIYDTLGNVTRVDEDQEYPYNELTLKWTFVETSLNIGYNFLHTKLIRPYITTGIAIRYRLAMNMIDYPEERDIDRDGRTKLLYNTLDTFKYWTFYYSLGVGLRYHQFAVRAFWGLSLGNIDQVDASQNTSLNVPSDSDDRTFSNYLSSSVYGVSLSIDLVTLNLIKKEVKQKIKTQQF